MRRLQWIIVALAGFGVWGLVFGVSFVTLSGIGIFFSLARLVGPLFAIPVLVATFVGALWLGIRVHRGI